MAGLAVVEQVAVLTPAIDDTVLATSSFSLFPSASMTA
jgi:hypothetical protein